MYALIMVRIVFGTEDGALFSGGALDFRDHVGMLLGESLCLFITQIIFTVCNLNITQSSIFMRKCTILIFY
jgi:hypothetical protein